MTLYYMNHTTSVNIVFRNFTNELDIFQSNPYRSGQEKSLNAGIHRDKK